MHKFNPIRTELFKEGDIIFTDINNFVYRKISEGTESKTSHVGILLKGADGRWVVAESRIPFSKFSSLENFISRSDNGWYAVRRLKKGLTPQEIDEIKTACGRRMGVLYHTGFNYDSRKMFCSKFVYEVFKEALNEEIGDLETFSQLLENNPEADVGFWKTWFFGSVPWTRRTVTPASQMEDEKLFDVLGENK